MKNKHIYWLVDHLAKSELHQAKISYLLKHNIGVLLIEDFEHLFQKYNIRRTSTIIIGDEMMEDSLFEGFTDLIQHPEFAGVRFILSLSKANPSLVRKSVQMGFRDIIPLDLPTKTWFQRFKFASSDASNTILPPVPQMTLRNISAISIPSRLVWIGKDYIRIEVKLKLKKGSQVKYRGGFSDYLGVKWISLTVEDHQETNLRYRFSDAYICKWEIPKEVQTKKDRILDILGDMKSEAPFKAFVAISNYELRQELLRRLGEINIDCNVALHKKSIPLEPKFLNPELVFVEDTLCVGKHKETFSEMLGNISKSTLVYIIGDHARNDAFTKIQDEYEHQFTFIDRFTPHFIEIISRKLEKMRPHQSQTDSYFIPKSNPLSFGEINLSSRLMKIHPEAIELALPYHLPNYAMIKIEAPILNSILKRSLVGKITSSYQHDNPEISNFPCLVECHFSDLLITDRKIMSERLVKIFAAHFNLDTPKSPTPKALKNSENSPKPIQKVKVEVPKTIVEEDIVIEPGGGIPEEKKLSVDDIPIVKEKSQEPEIAFLEAIRRGFVKYARDLKIIVFAICMITVFYYLVFKYRPPVSEQGRVYSEQLLKFQQRYQDKSQSP